MPARQAKATARRNAILAAALDEFSAKGFAAARLDDVARRADVAKGTIYLYFSGKESLFQELTHAMLSPMIGAIAALGAADMPMAVLAERFVDLFVREVYETRRRDVIRLIISEGRRFPKLAEFYYREVFSRIIAAVRALLRRALPSAANCRRQLIDFPQLMAAPGLIAIIWSGLFDRFEPLDARAMMRANLDFLFATRRRHEMTARLRAAAAICLLALLLAACNDRHVYQGWVEADLIFVAPEYVGRVQTLSVREGDTVKTGEPLFTVDDELQQADLAQVKASLINAQQTYDRASVLLKPGSGTQKDFDAAEAVLRDAQARFNSMQTRLARRTVFEPGQRHGAGSLLPTWRNGARRPSGAVVAAARQPQSPLLRARGGFCRTSLMARRVKVACDGCAKI